MKIHYLSENTPSGALVSMDYGGPSCVMVTQMLLSVTDVEPRERHGVTLTKNMHNQADDLTAERADLKEIARKLVLQINEITPAQWDKQDDKDQAIIIAAIKTARQEALREAARVVETITLQAVKAELRWREKHAVEEVEGVAKSERAECYMRSLGLHIKGELDRLASEGG